MEALWLGVGGVVTAIGIVIVNIITKRSEINKVARKDAIDEWRELTISLQAQNERRDASMKEMQKTIDSIVEDNSLCREETAEQRSSIFYIYAHVKRLHKIIVESGKDPGEVPELPVLKEREKKIEDPAFLAKQSAQSLEMIKEADKVILKVPEAPK